MVTCSPGFFGNGSFFRESVLYTCSGIEELLFTAELIRRRGRGGCKEDYNSGVLCWRLRCARRALCGEILLNQNDRMAPDCLAAADVADLLAGLRLHVHRVGRKTQERCHVVADSQFHWAELRFLR